jgi:transposase InsO family protein
VVDTFSREVVGWSMANHLRTELVLDALNLAVHNRRPAAALVHHSDRGSISGVYSLAFVQCSGMNYERLATSSRTA